MNDRERAKCLAAIRADRLARGGKPPRFVRRDLVIRSVIASMNMEGAGLPPFGPLATHPLRASGGGQNK